MLNISLLWSHRQKQLYFKKSLLIKNEITETSYFFLILIFYVPILSTQFFEQGYKKNQNSRCTKEFKNVIILKYDAMWGGVKRKIKK